MTLSHKAIRALDRLCHRARLTPLSCADRAENLNDFKGKAPIMSNIGSFIDGEAVEVRARGGSILLQAAPAAPELLGIGGAR